MEYRLMNDYTVGWPFWATDGFCSDDGRRLYEEVKRALPNDSITLEYWETARRDSS